MSRIVTKSRKRRIICLYEESDEMGVFDQASGMQIIHPFNYRSRFELFLKPPSHKKRL